MAHLESLQHDEKTHGTLRLNSLQCLQFARMESSMDKIIDETSGGRWLVSPCSSDTSGISSLSSSLSIGSWDGSDAHEPISKSQSPNFQRSEEASSLGFVNQGRDLTDLWSNIRGFSSFFTPTVLPSQDVNFFLNNRSVYDRLNKPEPLPGEILPFCEACYHTCGLQNSCLFIH